MSFTKNKNRQTYCDNMNIKFSLVFLLICYCSISVQCVHLNETFITMKHHQHLLKDDGTLSSNNHHKLHKRQYRSKYTIEDLLNMKIESKISNDIDMDPCKAGGFMGDIALPDVNYETESNVKLSEWKAPLIPPKFNKTFQQELEILKQEVYHEGLQVEEEGLTDIIRKKTKLPSVINENFNERNRNDPILSANEPVKPSIDEMPVKNLKSGIIIPIREKFYIAPTEYSEPKISIREKTISVDEEENTGGEIINAQVPIVKENKSSNVANSNRNVDYRKIQSNTKDIEDDSGNNFVSERKIIILPTSLPTPRSTMPNVFSNTGGNGNGRLDDVEFLQANGAVRRRHRRRGGKKTKRSTDPRNKYDEKVQRLRDELNRPVVTVDDIPRNHYIGNIKMKQSSSPSSSSLSLASSARGKMLTASAITAPHTKSVIQNPNELNLEFVKTKTFNYSSDDVDEFEVLTKRKSTMDAINAEVNTSPKNVENLKHLEHHHRITRAVTAKKERVWDYGVIPYEIDGNFSGVHKVLFKQAMRHWENFTCIKFVERDPEIHPNYIIFTVRSCGCCSFVGKRGNGGQAISIGRNCDKFGIVVHELGHVVGFWHEHTRPDREKHVVIELNNIMKGQDYNFNKLTPDDVDSLGMPYDYESIMHYARNTFSKGTYLDTILPIEIKGKKRPEIGQRLRLSIGDISQANLLYKCPKCGRTFQENNGNFTSPSYYMTGGYNETEKCEWRITATHGERIVLHLENLNIFKSEKCQGDYLEIRDGYYFKSPLIRRFCGKVSSETVITTTSRMLLSYVNTHRSYGHRGFKAIFEAICGGELSVDETDGRLESPNYPLEYLPNKECIWKITVPEGYQVALKFQSFEVENHDSCAYDYVEVRDGDSADSRLIGVFCGYKAPPDMKSSSNTIFVKFVSDGSVQKAGFSAIFMKEVDECETSNHGCEHECINTLGGYECSCHIGYELHSDKKHCEDACGGVIESINGTITSPSFPEFYPIEKDCIWEIIAPPRYKILLNFTQFELEGANRQDVDCSYDYVTIYSKLSEDRLKHIGTYCGTKIPPVATSEGNALRVEFHSDKNTQMTGFAAVFFTDIDECAVNNGGCQHECRNTIGSYLCFCHNGYSLHDNQHDCKEGECKYEITTPYGMIYSPNYPDQYPSNADCVWLFSTTPGHRLKLIFNEFSVEPHQECCYDHVAVYNGKSEDNSTLGRFCGDKIPYPITSTSNQMYMVMKTDKNKQRKGFSATHSTACGGYLRATTNIQQFYSHAKFANDNYDNNMDCVWTIQAPVGKNVQLFFLSMDIENNENCSYDYVEVYSGMEENSGPLYGRYCGSEVPQEIISLTDSLLIRFKSDESMSYKGFSASYVAVAPFVNSEDEERNSDSSEMITPFPGYMKSIFKSASNEDDYGDLSENYLDLNNRRHRKPKNRYENIYAYTDYN